MRALSALLPRVLCDARAAGSSIASSWPIGIVSAAFPASASKRALQPAHVFACFRQIQRAFLSHLRQHHWQLHARRPAARQHLAIRLHARHAPLSPHPVRAHGRFSHAHYGPSGTGKELVARAIAGSRYVPFDPERLEFADARPRNRSSHQHRRAFPDADRIGAVRPSPRLLHRRHRRSQRLARSLPAAGFGISRRTGRNGVVAAGEAAAGD